MTASHKTPDGSLRQRFQKTFDALSGDNKKGYEFELIAFLLLIFKTFNHSDDIIIFKLFLKHNI